MALVPGGRTGSPRQLRWWEALRVALEGLGLAKQGFGMNPNWVDAQFCLGWSWGLIQEVCERLAVKQRGPGPVGAWAGAEGPGQDRLCPAAFQDSSEV